MPRPTTRARRAYRAAVAPFTTITPDGLRLKETHFYFSNGNTYKVHAGGRTWVVEYDSAIDGDYRRWKDHEGIQMTGMGIPLSPAQFESLRAIFESVSRAQQEQGVAEKGAASSSPQPSADTFNLC